MREQCAASSVVPSLLCALTLSLSLFACWLAAFAFPSLFSPLQVIERMRGAGIILSPYLDQGMVQRIHAEVGMPMQPEGPGGQWNQQEEAGGQQQQGEEQGEGIGEEIDEEVG